MEEVAAEEQDIRLRSSNFQRWGVFGSNDAISRVDEGVRWRKLV